MTYDDYLQAREAHERLCQRAERHESDDTEDARIARENFKRIDEIEREHPDWVSRRYEEGR